MHEIADALCSRFFKGYGRDWEKSHYNGYMYECIEDIHLKQLRKITNTLIRFIDKFLIRILNILQKFKWDIVSTSKYMIISHISFCAITCSHQVHTTHPDCMEFYKFIAISLRVFRFIVANKVTYNSYKATRESAWQTYLICLGDSIYEISSNEVG